MTLESFFAYALRKKKEFYWAWNRFIIVVRHRRNCKRVLVLEVEMPDPPFIAKARLDVSHLPAPVLAGSLLYLCQHYPSSPDLRRNLQHSTRILSYASFLRLVPPTPTPSPTCAPLDRLLVAYLMQVLASHGILPR